MSPHPCLTIAIPSGESWSVLLPPSLLAALLAEAARHAEALDRVASPSRINPAAVAVVELQAALDAHEQ